ncbi:MAG: valine--tRNA ligase [Alphaproteobacteria bacterium]|jgi:valyl-tRNA synthetase|nr:valine--tRNA ligase [Alphaproteobacteria bacterium]MBT5390610.1 valine--tRNA ligase [Alphaproteobacteria bacterium]MBT5654264.1 valine--tRNA ligase [Alphaproteobacteria bacterium]
MLDKIYSPQSIEVEQYGRWEKAGAFACDIDSDAQPYVIMMPPANVTGTLHIGHALTYTLQDILCRYKRMQGRDVLWQPGTDHAGIATQMVVERQLAKEDLDRKTMGRDAFLERTWTWKETSGGEIMRQLRRLGASADWPRERFTMDEGLSRAVRKAFVDLYKEKLIYRDKRLVNWDPKLQTAISDLEVEQRDEKGHLWYIRYPIVGEKNKFITIATTRPETLLGDTAIAVNPTDERYKNLVGKKALLPLVGREIPIVADEYSDPEKGSGAVKITPAHDFNDFEVGKRHQLEQINIFDEMAALNENAPQKYQHLDRFQARTQILKDLEEQEFLVKTEKIAHAVPYGERTGTIIEPRLTDQWFMDTRGLADTAVKAVKDGKTKFVPQNFTQIYFQWLENIQPWCISRQLWWGHRIPIWYGPDGTTFSAMDEDQALAEAKKHYGKETPLTQDEDVLDTWFSSGLYAFSTLGWPDETKELGRYYPTSVLITGHDILFFWVARMMMMGLHFMKEVPFHTVYIHSLVLDEHGKKMSKSKGNTMDPLHLCDKYGADALRFTLTALAVKGRDIKLSEKRVEGYRNFTTKIWNVARYLQMNECTRVENFAPHRCRLTVNQWIVHEIGQLTAHVSDALEDYKFNDAAHHIYQFTWHSFCDWYIEFTKPILTGSNKEEIEETRATLAWSFSQLLHLAHPIMPFITEELWEKFSGGDILLITSPWPSFGQESEFKDAKAEIDWIIQFISEIRTLRAETNIPFKTKLTLHVQEPTSRVRTYITLNEDLIKHLGSVETIDFETIETKGALQLVVPEASILIPMADVLDIEQERSRLNREIEKLDGEIVRFSKKLDDQNFVARAPLEVVEEQKTKRSTALETKDRLASALTKLGQL